METDKPSIKILKILLKDIALKPTITSLSKEIGMTRVGLWKVLKRIEKEKLIMLTQIGTGKTSTYTISLNWENPLIEKILLLALTQDSMKNKRWTDNFKELENKVDFLIIYGSIIHSPKEANDIDILSAVSNKKHFKKIEEITAKIQKTQLKKIHIISLTPEEIKREIQEQNKAFINAIKQGIVLFGQEKFINFMGDLK